MGHRRHAAGWTDDEHSSFLETAPFRSVARADGGGWHIWVGSTMIMRGHGGSRDASKLMVEDALAAISITILDALGFVGTDALDRDESMYNACVGCGNAIDIEASTCGALECGGGSLPRSLAEVKVGHYEFVGGMDEYAFVIDQEKK
jgi:hypothetical protein